MRFTKEQQHQRIKRFLTFLDQQHLPFYPLEPCEIGLCSTFVVCRDDDLAYIELGFRRIILTARSGPLKDVLLSWIKKDDSQYSERVENEDIEVLDSYRYLLPKPSLFVSSPPVSAPPSGMIPLVSEDHPLVALATLLGYQVFLAVQPTDDETGTPVARYAVANPQGESLSGDDLILTFATLLKRELSR